MPSLIWTNNANSNLSTRSIINDKLFTVFLNEVDDNMWRMTIDVRQLGNCLYKHTDYYFNMEDAQKVAEIYAEEFTENRSPYANEPM